jgi:hypothetical protein
LARCIIVIECAPLLSTLLTEGAQSGEALAERAAAGTRQVNQAAVLLKELNENGDSSNAEELGQQIELLQAFAQVFAALAAAGDAEASKERLIDACGGLAMYLDDSEKEVAESAKFWQGVAYRRAGKPDRALEVLRPVLTTPASVRIGFLARLERCRALADRGEFVAALALATRLAARVDSWFDDEDEMSRKQAGECVRRLRVKLQRDWAARLRADSRPDRADEAEAQARKLSRKSGDASPELIGFALTEAIAGFPEIESKSRAPSTQEDEP